MLTDLVPSSLQALTPWRRRDALADFQRSMNQIMRDFFEDEPEYPALWGQNGGTFVPRFEMQESDDKITLSAELPGLDDKDVEVSVEKDYLTLKGEKKEEKETESAGRYVTERRYGAFERTVRLPASVDKDKISAKFDKGVLRIDVPKSSEAKKEVKKIPIKH